MRAIEPLGSAYWRACAYHAQQSAEKAVKAYLIHHQIRFPKIHDIDKLAQLIEEIDPQLAKDIAAAKRLTKYAIEYRYPSVAKNPMTKAKIRSAARLAERVYERIAAALRGA